MTIPIDDINAIFAEWDRHDSPGCALAVIRDGQIAYARGYGMANLEHSVRMTPQSIFHVASISKQFTDMCIALLAADGKLALDDDIRALVPEIPSYGDTITIRHLIHHTSGLRDMWDLLSLAGWRPDDLINEADMLWVASRQTAPNFAPGDEYLYSNTGYALLAVIVRRVSGQSLRAFAHERIFGPLGMDSTHIHDDHTEIVPGRTQAYEPRAGGGLRISIPVFDIAGTTSLFTTVEDMARWDDNFSLRRVGGDALIEQMLTPGQLNGNRPISYGFGLQIYKYRGLPAIEHGGADAGYRAHYLRFPDERVSVMCCCNLSTMPPRTLALAVADLVLADRFTEPLDDDTPESAFHGAEAELAGIYRSRETGDLLRVAIDDDGLSLGFHDPQRLQRLVSGAYLIEGQRLARLRFEGREGAMRLIHGALSSPTPEPVYEQVVGHDTISLPAITGGEFYSAELDTTYWMEPGDDTIELTHYRLEERMLHHAVGDTYASNNLRIELERDTDGTVTGFQASTARVRNVRFVRC